MHEDREALEREDWNRKHGAGGLLFGAEPNRFLVDEVAGLAPGRALDLACGSGRNAVWLAQQGWQVTGVEFSDVALEQARALAAERGVDAEWIEADLRTWEPPARAFDLVVIQYLHLAWADMSPILIRAAEAVAPGGTMLVVGHHADNIEHGSGGPQDPRVLYTAEDVARSLGALEIEKAEAVRRDDAIDALVRARRPGL